MVCHLERREKYEWVSACMNVSVAGARGRGRGERLRQGQEDLGRMCKTAKLDIKSCGPRKEAVLLKMHGKA